MKRFDFEIQIACTVAFTLSLLVYFVSIVPYFFDARNIAKNDVWNSCVSFESAVIKATNDFNDNKLRIILNNSRTEFINSENDLNKIEKNYGVLFINGGCVCCSEYVRTYDKLMKQLINDKYQKLVFRTTDMYFYNYLKANKFLPSEDEMKVLTPFASNKNIF